MGNDYHPAKVTRPQAGRVFPRTRLFARLDEMTHAPCVWVAAPPGSGKTTLVNSWVEAGTRPCLWYQVDPRDANPATFFHYLGLAAAAARPARQVSLPALTPEYLPGLPIFARNYFERLCQALPADCVLVFDNCQELAPDAPVQALFAIAVETLLPGQSVLALSRTDPPAALSRERANGVIVRLPAAELSLTDAEARGIVARRSARPLAAAELDDLLGRAGGWVAGLVLLLEHTNEGIEACAFDAGSPQCLFDYFAGEVLSRMQPQEREWLYRCALLPRMTRAMVARLCDSDAAGNLLGELDRNNYFIARYRHEPPVYQLHPLFREFLLNRAHSLLPADALQQTSALAAHLLEADGAVEDAVELYLGSGAWNEVSRIVQQHARTLLSQGRNDVLAGWIGALPEAALEQQPWLRCWQAYSHMPFEAASARALFEQAYRDLQAAGETTGIILAWSGLIDTFQLGQGRDGAALDHWLAEARAALLPLPQGLPPEIEGGFVHAMLLALVFREPGGPACREWAARAERCLRACPDSDTRVRIALVLMLYRLWMGNYAGARLLNEELRDWLQQDRVSPLARLTAGWAGVMCEWMTGSPAAAVRQVESGIRLGRETGVLLWERIFLGHGVEAALAAGDMQTADRWLKALEAGLDPDAPWDYSQYHHLACLASLGRGQAAVAREHAQLSFAVIRGNAVHYLDVLTRLDLVESLRSSGEPVAAGVELGAARQVIGQIDSRLFQFMACLCESSLALDEGREKAAAEALREGLAIGRACGISSCWSWRNTVMQRLCSKALEHGIEVNYVRSLIRERSLIPDTPPLEIDDWPWPVRIRTLGAFSVEIDDTPLDFSGKAQKKPLELLKVLLAFGGRAVSLSRLEETVWPDAEGDAAHRSFGTALHRLRRLLGGHDTLVLEPGSLSLNPRRCWVDRWVCDARLDGLDRELQSADGAALRRLAGSLFALYRGPFLAAESDAAWALPPRERLQRRMLRAILKLGRHWEAQADWAAAADCYRRGLNLEPQNGALCERLMLAYRHLDQQPEALLAYRQHRDSLSSRDGREPSPEIRALYENMNGGHRATR